MNNITDSVITCFFGYMLFHLILNDIMSIYVIIQEKLTNTNQSHKVLPSGNFEKLCDIVQKCVMGYYVCVLGCFEIIVSHLDNMICKYLEFCETCVECFTMFPNSIVFTAGTVLVVNMLPKIFDSFAQKN